MVIIKKILLNWWGTPKFKQNLKKATPFIKRKFRKYDEIIIVETTDGSGGTTGVYTALSEDYAEQGKINLNSKKTYKVERKKMLKGLYKKGE